LGKGGTRQQMINGHVNGDTIGKKHDNVNNENERSKTFVVPRLCLVFITVNKLALFIKFSILNR
jgi:hypothetical protein